MIKRKATRRFIEVLLLTAGISCLFVWGTPYVNIEGIMEEDKNFQYNMITLAVTLAGFLFTGISILISTFASERIKRLWDHNYLNNLCRSAYAGMITSVLIIISAFILIWCSMDKSIRSILIEFQIILTMIMLVFFSWCVLRLISVLKKLRDDERKGETL